jgi:hypothetical protein
MSNDGTAPFALSVQDVVLLPGLHDSHLKGVDASGAALELTFTCDDGEEFQIAFSARCQPLMWCEGVCLPTIISHAWFSPEPPPRGWLASKVGEEVEERLRQAVETYSRHGWVLLFDVHMGDSFAVCGIGTLSESDVRIRPAAGGRDDDNER